MSLTYSSYLKLDELLSMQQPLSDGPEHDEMLFIIIHQVYELWFKEILHELDYLKELLQRSDQARALHTLKRILTILKILVTQLDVLETMTPLEFLSFRDQLESASGFQSFQFRELEFALGLKRRTVMARFPEGSEGAARLQRRFDEPSLWDAFLSFLSRKGYPIPASSLTQREPQPVRPSPEIQAVLIDIYHNDAAVTELCERLVDVDEGIQEWRYRHVKMVERTIGNKRGTGGSSGVEYLTATLSKPLFPDLWAIRTEL
ncbi:MAG: tryptophan 2,3-dioxygenase [Anaerolineae bacterium]